MIAALEVDGITPVFSGGTSLSTAWQLIRRFSEDIDFKVGVTGATPSGQRKKRSAYREEVIESLTAAGFVLDGDLLVGNVSRFFRASFDYAAMFPAAAGVRPTLKIEMTFAETFLPPVSRPVRSLLGQASKDAPELGALLCVDPVETAADKLSALAWRTAARDRKSDTDDPSIVRHLHDLAALGPMVEGDPRFKSLALRILEEDAKRSGRPNANGRTLLKDMLPEILEDLLWRKEYEEFVAAVSYGPHRDRIGFDQAVTACEDLVSRLI